MEEAKESNKAGFVDELRRQAVRNRFSTGDQLCLKVSLELNSLSSVKVNSVLQFHIPTAFENSDVENIGTNISNEIKSILYSLITNEDISNNSWDLDDGDLSNISKGFIPSTANNVLVEAEDDINTKFIMVEGAVLGSFGNTSLFFKGLDEMLGLPDF